MTYFYNISTQAIINYEQLKELYPMFSWPKKDNGQSVDVRLEMSERHPDILQYKRLIDLPKPETTRYEVAEQADPVYQNSRWERPWNIRSANSEEIALIDESLISEIKSYRDNDWSSSQITISNGAILAINERTRRDVQDTLTGLLTAGIDEYTGWNAVNGVYNMTILLFQEAILLAMSRVKKSFDAYNYVISNHANTPYQDDSWKDDFNDHVEGLS